jgi:hypothetical protein
MRSRLLLSLLLMLPACTKAGVQESSESARQVAIDMRDNAIKTKENAKTYFNLPPYQKPMKKPAQTAYCYRTASDILCYPTPVAGAETRMVGMQQAQAVDEEGQVGDSAAPVISVSQAVDSPGLIHANDSVPPASSQPYHAFEVKPIFIDMAPAVTATAGSAQGQTPVQQVARRSASGPPQALMPGN